MLADPYDPQQLNRYSYVRNNPVKYTDPSGNFGIIAPLIDWGWTGFDLASQQYVKWNPNSTEAERGAASLEQRFILGAEMTAILASQGADGVLPGDDIGRNVVKRAWQSEARQALSSVGGEGFSSFYNLKKHIGAATRPDALHHIVAQNKDNIFKFGNEQIHNTKNVIKLPDSAGDLHRKITGFYNSKQGADFGLSSDRKVRDIVNEWSYKKQYNFGVEVIKHYGGDKYLQENGINYLD